MITINNISDINYTSDEGKLLTMAIAALTSLDKSQIDAQKWGGMVHPDKALGELVRIANEIYFTEEYKKYKVSIQRDNKINDLLKDSNGEQ